MNSERAGATGLERSRISADKKCAMVLCEVRTKFSEDRVVRDREAARSPRGSVD